MARYVAGDAAAFRQLYERHALRLARTLRRRVEHKKDVADLVQQTFPQLHRAHHDFRPRNPLRPWLYTIALNLIRRHYRTRGQKSRQESLEVDPIGRGAPPDERLERE